MNLKTLATKSKAYRKKLNLNQGRYAGALGVGVETVRRLHNGEVISDALIKKINETIDEDAIKPYVHQRDNELTGFANLPLAMSLDDEREMLATLAGRYLGLVNTHRRSGVSTYDLGTMAITLEGLVTTLKLHDRSIPMQRHCMVLGLIQGLLVKKGIITMDEALHDHNTLYYVA